MARVLAVAESELNLTTGAESQFVSERGMLSPTYSRTYFRTLACLGTYVLSLMVVLLLVPGFLTSARAQYRLDLFDISKGLPQNSITGLVMTHDGYIWVTTNDGLARFDGVRFTVFNRGNTPQLSTNRLSGAFEDRSGRLWVLGEDGSVVFRKDGQFTVASEPNAILPVNRSPLFDDFVGGVILYSNHKNYQYVDGRFVPLHIPGVPDDSTIILSDRGGRLWFTKGTRAYDVLDGRVTVFDLSQYARSGYHAAYQDRYGNVWLSFSDEYPANLLRIRNGQVQSFDFPARYAWRFTEDLTGDLWFTDYNRGTVYRIGQKSLSAAELLPEDITPVATIAGAESVTSGWLCPDREGGMWVGTDKGLVRMQPQNIRVFSKSDGLPDENVYPIYQDHTGAIWAGIWPNTLARYEGGKFQAFLRTKQTFYIASLFEDNTGRFWYGGTGTLHYLQDGKPIDFTAQLGCEGAEVAAITQDRDGSLWFGTSHGLIRYANGRVTWFTTADGLPDNYIDAFLQTRDGKLWVGTHGGVAVFPPAPSDAKLSPVVVLTERNGLASNYTRCIYQDSDGVIWIGSYDGGLTRYKDGKLTRYTTNNGLHGNGVFCILEDDRGWFWMNSNQGIYRARKDDLNDFAEGKTSHITCIAYATPDGLLNIEGNGGRQPAGIKSRDGRLWFPTAQGVAVVDPGKVTTNTVPPSALIEEVQVDRKPVASDLFPAAAGVRPSPITLKPGQNDLEIQYTGLSFVDSQMVAFKYRLEGLDSDWNQAGTRRSVYYSYLPPGHYTFQVLAANRDGVWSETPASIPIVVLPPFYRTWWFTALIGLIILGIGTAGYQYRVQSLKQARAAQEGFARQLIASVERERKRIAAELHDSLGQNLLIAKNWARLAMDQGGKDDAMTEPLDEISSAVTQAIEEVREISRNLRPQQLERLGLTNALRQMIERVDVSSGIAFTAEIDDLAGVMPAESEINFYRVIQESINNIVKHSEASRTEISIKRLDGGLNVTIRDNGKGFSLPTASANGGFGLTGIAERVRFLGGKYEIKSVPGEGTLITISILGNQARRV